MTKTREDSAAKGGGTNFVGRIDHVAIAVENLDVAIEWYRSAMGLECVERRHTRGMRTGMISAVLARGDVVVVLIQGTEPESQVSRFIEHFGAGVQHVAFAVDDLDKMLDQVGSAGGKADTGIIRDAGIRQVFLQRSAASGVRVELIERKGGRFTDESVNQLFRNFESKGLY